jgi:hypothetical protein
MLAELNRWRMVHLAFLAHGDVTGLRSRYAHQASFADLETHLQQHARFNVETTAVPSNYRDAAKLSDSRNRVKS